MRLNELDELSPEFRKLLPLTDSRFRPDMRRMERGDIGVLIHIVVLVRVSINVDSYSYILNLLCTYNCTVFC